MMSGVMGLGKKIMNQSSGAAEKTKQTKTSPADVIMWSGCKDSQTVSRLASVALFCRMFVKGKMLTPQSADTQEAGRATGAMSYVSNYQSHSQVGPQSLMSGLYRCFDQIPAAKLCPAAQHDPRRAERPVRSKAPIVGFAP
jgi:hypothetical protein